MSISTRATGRKSRYFRTRLPALPPKVLASLAADLQAGGVAIFPTETVYGIGTSVFSLPGIKRIYALKGRHGRKPLALLVPTLEAARPLVERIPPEADRLAGKFWPGPLTLIFQASALGRLVTGGLTTIGVRIPDHPVALALLKKVGVPLATTSVNRSGEKPAVSGAACHRFIAQALARGLKSRSSAAAEDPRDSPGAPPTVDWLIDAGTCRVKAASSVVDLSHYPFTITREGAISRRTLEKTLFR